MNLRKNLDTTLWFVWRDSFAENLHNTAQAVHRIRAGAGMAPLR